MNLAILLFDSGLGGLSIRREIQTLCPDLTIHQCSDHAWIPYGLRSPSEITERVTRLLPSLIDRLQPKLVVIACNTASTETLPRLRQLLDIPVVGVVPAIKPAASLSESKDIFVLATSHTVKSAYTHQLIDAYAPSHNVQLIAADELVEFAEHKLRGIDVNASLNAFCHKLSSQIHTKHNATIVLACTHFPLLLEELSEGLPPELNIIDSGQAVAKRVKNLLKDNIHDDVPAHFFTTGVLDSTLSTLAKHEGFSIAHCYGAE